PCLMSKHFQGEPIINLMDSCGVQYVTLGNHEFDHDQDGGIAILSKRLAEAHFTTIGTNWTPQSPLQRYVPVSLWPEKDPFIVIMGIAGKDTIEDAKSHGFKTVGWENAFSKVLKEQVMSQCQIRCVIVLSHMDRDEDKALQVKLDTGWNRQGFGYVLG